MLALIGTGFATLGAPAKKSQYFKKLRKFQSGVIYDQRSDKQSAMLTSKPVSQGSSLITHLYRCLLPLSYFRCSYQLTVDTYENSRSSRIEIEPWQSGMEYPGGV